MSHDIVNTVRWFGSKTNDLSNEISRKNTLIEIKAVLSNLDNSQLLQVSRSTPLNSVFDCLNTSDSEEIELTSNIIFMLLQHMNGVEQLNLYGPLLRRALSHPSPSPKTTVLRLLEKIVDGETLSSLNSENLLLLVEAANCLASPDRSIAQGAITTFINMGKSPQGLSILFSQVFVDGLKNVMLVDDTSRFRVYEILVAVSEKSVEGLQASHASGLLPLLLTEIKSTDHLIQLNALEVMNTLATCNHGLLYLQESGVIQYLVDKISKLEEEPLSFVLLPGLIEFFGNLYKLQPKQFSEQYPNVLGLLFQSMDTADPVLLGVIISTVGKIGSTNAGKQVLNNSDKMVLFLKRSGQLLSSKNDTTVSVMNSLSELIKTDDPSLTPVTKQWFEELGPSALETVANIAKLPFVELRLSALMFLNAIAKQPWGAEKLCCYPGMIEFLTDRSAEFNKDCKNAKFDIAVSITNNPVISDVLTSDVIIKLREFVSEGPFFVPTVPETAFEGA